MDSKRLDHKLDCKACGKILMDIPDNAEEHTAIHCSQCGGVQGAPPHAAPPVVEPYGLDGGRFGKPQKQLQDPLQKNLRGS
jgi:hypothetical protein